VQGDSEEELKLDGSSYRFQLVILFVESEFVGQRKDIEQSTFIPLRDMRFGIFG
jgi:hypothetical protein